ncbi:MAG: kelch repeat-containing protein [Candidatus Sumerlaeota bacterium]|nr:kelch repeat-containing protein [Candidatus Sumerlaeota bacterium]
MTHTLNGLWSGIRRALTALCLISAIIVLPDRASGSPEPSWVSVGFRGVSSAMAYDSARNRVVLFGGVSIDESIREVNETWEWDGASWMQLHPAVSPPARDGHAMAFDTVRRRVVLFGGVAGSFYYNDTWEWDGTNWTQCMPANSPSPRSEHAMVWDVSRNRVFLFAGGHGITDESDTWEWDGSNWTQLAPLNAPPGRRAHAMAYDAGRDRIVLFGGYDHLGMSYDYLDDTWEWNGVDWDERTPVTVPAARSLCAMAYDLTHNRIVMFGGLESTDAPSDSTWLWDGVNWTQPLIVTKPDARRGHAMVWHDILNRVVLFGGMTAGGFLNDLWLWNGSSWTLRFAGASPRGRYYHAMTTDPSTGRTVLFGGYYFDGSDHRLGDTWEWDGAMWRHLSADSSTLSRYGHAMAWDGVNNKAMIFGGSNGTFLSETREWTGVTWQELFPIVSPHVRSQHAMVHDKVRNVVVLFGGAYTDLTTFFLGDTWEWDGVKWIQRMPAHSPPARAGHAMAFDPERGRIVMFGGNNIDGASLVYYGDTWEWNGSDWIERVSIASPPARTMHSMAWNGNDKKVVLYGGVNDSGVLGDTWEWSGATWSLRHPLISPGTLMASAMAWDTSNSRVMLFGGNNLYRTIAICSNSTWEWPKPTRMDVWRDDTFTTGGLNPPGSTTGTSAFGFQNSLAWPDYDPARKAYQAYVTADPTRYRVTGVITNQTEWMPYALVGTDHFVRVKYYIYAALQADPTDGNQIPNMRLRAQMRFAQNSMLEVFNHTNDPSTEQQLMDQELRPSTDASRPSLYRVDLDPIDVPCLRQNSGIEGVQRAFEAYAIYPQDNGLILLTESVIGTYPAAALPDTGAPAKVYAANGVNAGNLAVRFPGELDIANLIPGTGVGEFATRDMAATPDQLSTHIESGAGITMDSANVPTNRVGYVSREFTHAESFTTALRVEEGKQYKVRWHLTSTQQSNLQAQIRMRGRSIKFAWSQKLEIGGAQAAGSYNNMIAQQMLPGAGCKNPDKYTTDTQGGWHTMLIHTPMCVDIRPEFSAGTPLAARMPVICAQPGPGADAPSRRDLRVGIDLIDTLSGGALRDLERGQFLLDRIEVRVYDTVPD